MSVGHKDKDTIEYTSSKNKARGLSWWLNGKNLPAIAGDTDHIEAEEALGFLHIA